MGTQTYISAFFFLIYSYKYMANHYYELKDIKKFNKYTSMISFTIKNYNRILVGQNGNNGLIDTVNKIMIDISGLDFIEQERKDLVELSNKVKKLVEPFKTSIRNMKNLNEFIENKPTIEIEFDFSKTQIKTPINKWKDLEEVSYAIQFRNGTELSQISDWSAPYKIFGKACPLLKLKKSSIKGDRLIYRKISDNEPELVQIIKSEKQEIFRDISKDIFDVIFKNENEDLSMIDMKQLLSDGTNVNDLNEDELPLIHHLTKKNKINCTRELIENYGLNITAKDSDGKQAIHLASELGYKRMTKLFIEHKADVNCKTKLNWTPFHYSCKSGNEEFANYLIEKGANISATTENEFNAFHISSLSDNPNMIEFLKTNSNLDINSVSNEGLSSLHLAIMNENVSCLKALLKDDNLINVNIQTKEGQLTPLHLAVSVGNLETVKLLLQNKNIDVNYLSKERWSALHLSIFSEKEETTLELLKIDDIDVNLKGKSNLTALHMAVMKNQEKIVKILLNKEAQIEERALSGSTALHIAVDNNNYEIMKLLVNKGAKLNVRQDNGNTPLLLASSDKSKFKIVKFLTQKGARLDDENEIGNTPIDIASAKGNLLSFNYLKKSGANLDTALNLAVYGNQIEIVNLLIKNNKSIIYKRDKSENSILHYAALSGNTQMIKYFIDQDQFNEADDLNSKNSDGDSILNLCASIGNYVCVRYLSSLEKIDLNTINNENYNPILKAANSQNWPIVEYLSSNELVNIKQESKHGNTVLHFACRDNEKEMIDYLLDDLEIDVNILNKEKWSPLSFATRSGHLDLVKYLIEEKNSNYELIDQNDYSILHLSVLSDNLELVKYLIEEKKLKVNSKNSLTSCLHLAVKFNYLDILKYLLEKGSEINSIDKDGNTPLLLGAKEKSWSSVKLLIEKEADIGIINNEKNSFLHMLANSSELDILELLKKKNVNLGRGIKNNLGMNCVHISALNNQFELTKWFIENNFVFEKDNLGNTPLHYSAKVNDLTTTKYLSSKFDPNSINYAKETPCALTENVNIAKFLIEEKKVNYPRDPLKIAKNDNNLGVLKYLIKYLNLNPNLTDDEGKNILIYSAQNNFLNKVKYLINDLKIDINKKDKFGKTAKDYSISSNHTSIELYLDEMNNLKDITTFSSPQTRYDVFKAIEKNDLKLVKYFLDNNKKNPFDYKGYDDKSLLHLAAIKGNLDIVKYLVNQKKFNPTTKDKFGNLAVHDSSFYGKLDITKFFIEEKKIPLNANTSRSDTVLHKSSMNNQIETIRYLVGKGSNVYSRNIHKYTPIHLATLNGHLDVVRFFIEEKKVNIETKGFQDQTPLFDAGWANEFLIFYYLITKNANVNAKDTYKQTPLHLASSGGCLSCVKHLIEKSKVNIEEKAYNYETALFYSCKHNRIEILKYLLSKNANINVREYTGYNYCIHEAAKNGALDVLKHLIENLKLDIEKTNYHDCTPLHRAAQYNQLLTVKYLVKKGANRKAKKCHAFKTPLEMAKENGNTEIVKYLEKLDKANFETLSSFENLPPNNGNSSLKIEEQKSTNKGNQDMKLEVKNLDLNSTLMLLNVLVRKYTKENFVSGVNEELSILDAKMMTLNILDSFERVLKENLKNNDIEFDEYLNYDPTSLIEEIVYHLRNGNSVDKISKLLISVLENNYKELDNTEQIKEELIENLEDVLMKELNITTPLEYSFSKSSNDYLIPMNKSKVNLIDSSKVSKIV